MHAVDIKNELEKTANEIKPREIYGLFDDDKHYLWTLDLLLASTSETENRNHFFMNNILPNVSAHAMIDVGIGDGKLTGLIGNHFQEITLVDISEHALKDADFHLTNKNVKLKKIVGSILDVNLPANNFNLAILSHTLYYLDVKLWLEVAMKLLSSLKQDGLLVIVMNDGLDKDIIADIFEGHHLDVDAFIHDCRKQLNVYSVDVTYSTEYFQTKNLLTMLHIVGLHLYDVGAVATSKQLSNYLSTKKDQLTELYQFLVYQKFITIRK